MEGSKKQQHLNQHASLIDEAGERDIINPEAERSSGCHSCAQGNLREGKARAEDVRGSAWPGTVRC